ncbi:MAG: T9SS type A sorting domain-containing protein [Candidatus Zixiibacteriota bacterium]
MSDITIIRGRVVTAFTLAVALCVALRITGYASDMPVGITIKKVSTYRAELLWFCSNINDSIAAHDDGGWEAAVAVRHDDRDNRAAVKFSDFSVPVFVTAGSAFVLNLDPDPSNPGDPLSTIEISLHRDNAGVPGEMVSGPVTVAASGEWTGGGEWVTASLSYLHDNSDPLWLQVRWPSSNPFMPKLGGDGGMPMYNSYVGYATEGGDVWVPYGDFEIMLRLHVLNNGKDSPIAPDESETDSFRVYSRDRLPLYPCGSLFDTSTAGFVLNQRVIPYNIDNYYCVTAWLDGVESSPSDIVHIEGSSGASAPASITPRHIELAVPLGSDTVAYMAIKNKGYATLQYQYSDDPMFAKAADGFPMTILNGSGLIYPGRTDSIVFLIGSANLGLGDYMEVGSIGFSDSLEVYSPEDVSVYLVIDQLTSVDNIDEFVPRSCFLHQNSPNPFNGETVILLESPALVTEPLLRIVDILGRRVADIAPARSMSGVSLFEWDGCDGNGHLCPSGVYFYAVSNLNTTWQKMLMIR